MANQYQNQSRLKDWESKNSWVMTKHNKNMMEQTNLLLHQEQ